MDKLTISVAELAKQLGISKPTAYDLVSKEGFPSIRISKRRILIPIQALNEWFSIITDKPYLFYSYLASLRHSKSLSDK